MNRITICGRLTQDPELRETSTGRKVGTLNVATTKTWKDRDGQKKEEVQYHRVIVWAKRAENCAEHLMKGSQVLVEGEMTYRQYEKDGITRYTAEINSTSVKFLDSPLHQRSSGTSPDLDPSTDETEKSFSEDDIPF